MYAPELTWPCTVARTHAPLTASSGVWACALHAAASKRAVIAMRSIMDLLASVVVMAGRRLCRQHLEQGSGRLELGELLPRSGDFHPVAAPLVADLGDRPVHGAGLGR